MNGQHWRILSVSAAALGLAFSLACAGMTGGEAAKTPLPEDPVERAIALAKAVDAGGEKAPADVLVELGSSQGELEGLMFDIAGDPDKTSKFLSGRKAE